MIYLSTLVKIHRQKIVAVIVERSNSYARQIIEGIADFAASHENWTMELIDPQEMEGERLDRYDGFIVRTPNASSTRRIQRCARPTIETGGILKGHRNAVLVRSDIEAVSRLAAEHFLSLRHVNFAYCGFDGQRYSHERATSFAEALRPYGHAPIIYESPRSSRSDFTHGSQLSAPLEISDRDALRLWLKSLPKPIALFCCNDRRAFHVLRICREAGIAVPTEISICGVDNDPVLCSFLSPRLTSIDPDAHKVGAEAAAALAGLMGETGYLQRKPGEIVSIPPKGIVTRMSSTIFPVDPPWLCDALMYIRRHTCEHLTSSEICAFVQKSNSTVNNAFRSKLNTTVQKEIAAARLEVARTLLIGTNLSIREIATRSGFASAEYFCRCFSQAYGCSPSDFKDGDRRLPGRP